MCIITKNCKIQKRNAKFRHILQIWHNIKWWHYLTILLQFFSCWAQFFNHRNIHTNCSIYLSKHDCNSFQLIINKCPSFHWLFWLECFLGNFLPTLKTTIATFFLHQHISMKMRQDGFLLIKGCVNTELDLEGM